MAPLRQSATISATVQTMRALTALTEMMRVVESQFPLTKPEGFFIASSIEMNLTLARTMAAAGMPSIVKGVCETLLQLMSRANGAIFEGVSSAGALTRSWTSQSLASIETFASEVSAGVVHGVKLATENRTMGDVPSRVGPAARKTSQIAWRCAQNVSATCVDPGPDRPPNGGDRSAETTAMLPSVVVPFGADCRL